MTRDTTATSRRLPHDFVLVTICATVLCGSVAHAGEDPHSYANTELYRTTHADMTLDLDFERRMISGAVDLTLDRVSGTSDDVVLDTRNLVIRDAWWVRKDGTTAPLDFRLGPSDEHLGRPLSVRIRGTVPPTLTPFTIRISYQTHPVASGLQWLDPAQTAGGEQPFLFTQSQAIHARSWIPLQDTPQVRLTYTATVHTPKTLVAVMSAEIAPDTPGNGEYRFTMPQAIPSYLIALAVGNLRFQSMGERTGVFAEPELLEAAAAEFEDTEIMLETSEALFGPYAWGRYDILILPPSFPFGGMENPRLSFITPTVIAGDKSLVALIAHELAHSWSGNLVTNATWNDLWLNEGFTVFFESRIMEAIYGLRRKNMEDVLGYQSLQRDLDELGRGDETLFVDLQGRDPDEAFTNVPYEKGRLLLVYLEDRFGREAFDEFLRRYFEDFAFRSLNTTEFVDYLAVHLLDKNPDVVSRADIEDWVYDAGIPGDAVLPVSDAFELVDAEREAWLDGEKETEGIQSAEWTVHEWLYFINNLPSPLEPERLAQLDAVFNFTASANNEIVHSWLKLCVISEYEPANDRLRSYLREIGRIKLIRPLYEELVKTDSGSELATSIYEAARPGYHPLTARIIDGVLEP